MKKTIPGLLHEWLSQLNAPVSKAYLKKQLLSHPDYPSLSSITDVLSLLDIDKAALIVDKSKLNEIPIPFLAHTSKSGEEFILVSNINTLYKKYPDFDAIWNGVVVAAEKPEIWNNQENEKQLKTEKKKSTHCSAQFLFGTYFRGYPSFL